MSVRNTVIPPCSHAARGNESKILSFKASFELRHSNFMKSKAYFSRLKDGFTI